MSAEQMQVQRFLDLLVRWNNSWIMRVVAVNLKKQIQILLVFLCLTFILFLCPLLHTQECVVFFLGYLKSLTIFTGNDKEIASWDWLLRLMSRSVMVWLWANHKAVNAARGRVSPGLNLTGTAEEYRMWFFFPCPGVFFFSSLSHTWECRKSAAV